MKPTGLALASIFALLAAACPDSGAVLSGGGVSDIGGDGVSGPVVSDALILKKLGGDEPDATLDGGSADGVVAADGAADSTGGDVGMLDASADAAGVDAALIDAGGADSTGADAASPDVAQDTGTPDTGTLDTGTLDTGTPDTGTPDTGTPDTGSSASTAACFALLGATCDKLGQCAAEIPFGGDQFAQYAAQCNDIVADPAGQLESGCEAAAGSFSGVTPADAADCIDSFDCGLSGLGTLAQALYPVFQAYGQGDDIAGTIPGAVDALLGACK